MIEAPTQRLVLTQSPETVRHDEQFGSGRRVGRAGGRRQQGHRVAAVWLESVDRSSEQLRR